MKKVSAWLLEEAPISLFTKEKWALVFYFSLPKAWSGCSWFTYGI
jgi:hypothetical protein